MSVRSGDPLQMEYRLRAAKARIDAVSNILDSISGVKSGSTETPLT